ncbi:MAG: molybdopterin molybdotransferase MoeA [Actinobacteria bacterium]|nr:molybdopterin molybdotransferase MoeA [Actinomycetota bacterium]
MRSVEEHLQRVLAGVVPLSPLDVTLLDARGCVLAEDVTAPWPLPPFDNSAMDGYAVRIADVQAASDGKPVTLRVIDDVPAGYRASVDVREGTAIRIMTGAPLPEGAEAVVPVEWTDAGMPEVTISRDVSFGQHVRRRGDDVSLGDVVATSGTVLGPREIALLAAVGRGRVSVHPQPRVVILSTGNELVEPGTPLQPGLITDSNGVTIAAAVQEAGAIAYRVGPVPDDAPTLLSTLEDQLVRADLIVTTGGVSAGAYDTVKAVLSRLGTVEFTKVAMQPGMPQGHGSLGPESTPIFTLPGNPVSAYVSFEVFVRPVLRRMLGHQRIYRPVVRAVLTETLMSPAGKRQFARGHLAVEDGRYVVRPAGGQGSHMLGALSQANCLVVVPEDVSEVKPGTALAVLRLDES